MGNPTIRHRLTDAVLFEGDAGMTTRQMLEKATASDADLSGADLIGADLSGAYLRGAYLRGADLRGADLSDAYLRGADLRDADLSGADLRGAYLSGADLIDAYLRGAYLRGAYLRDADLSGADLIGADLSGADLSDADLRDAELRDAELRGADGKPLRATNAEAIENLDKVRAIILDDQARLDMEVWHAESGWKDRTCAEETICGTTHCLAGWLQVCSTKPEIRSMDAELAGILSAPVAAKMFFKEPVDVLPWLESRAYVAELAKE